METEWERLAYSEIDGPTVSRLMRCWAPGQSVDEVALLPKGRRNTNYRVTLEGCRCAYVLRLYAAEDSAWKKEGPLHARLRDVVPVPRLFYSVFDRALFPKPFAIFEFVEGATLDERLAAACAPPRMLLEEIGECLARVHERTYSTVGFLDEHLEVAEKLPPFETWYKLFLGSRATERLGRKTAERIHTYVARNALSLRQIESDITLVHGDFRPENLLVRDGKLVGILDWEGAMAGHRLSDLGQFIRHEDRVSGTLESWFIEGYQREAKLALPSNWKQLARLRDLANLLQMLDAEEEKRRLYSCLKKLVTRIVESW